MQEGFMETMEIDSLNDIKDFPCIFRVDRHLRSGACENIYEPEILAIGPYHHGKSHLQYMENIKHMYLKRLLERRNDLSMDKLIKCVVDMEKRARKCYSEPLDHLSESDFVMMMLLDGCFLIELFHYSCLMIERDVDDPIFIQERTFLPQLCHDIFLLENQLPFFVLNQLSSMTRTPGYLENELIFCTMRFAAGTFLKYKCFRYSVAKAFKNMNRIDHLVGVVHYATYSSIYEIKENNNHESISDKLVNINTASVLEEFGIKLRGAEEYFINTPIITFEKGELRIPRLCVYDETESQLRNLVVYEQNSPDGEIRYVTDYIFFMQCLIKNSRDVELLRSNGIIGNYLGNDDEVWFMFNRVGRNIRTSSSNFCYSQVFSKVNQHCRPIEKWKANLRKNYFNTPWSIISKAFSHITNTKG